ncbi:hypothetical protein [Hydrocarboniphaga effusa]|uniref:hypothetical protein n=1 Tax=Hydrocarboniphaga effusa TaxID=243629 RepID=UPI00398BD5F7
MNFAILATGPSLTKAQANAVCEKFTVIAISDAIRLAPWADVLVSSDAAWWRHHQPSFEGRRFSAQEYEGCEQIAGVKSGLGSGALAIKVARFLGAKRIILLGYDSHGTHFFGKHPQPLKNTTQSQRMIHRDQLAEESRICQREGVEVVNATPGTMLQCFRIAPLEAIS